MTAATGVRPQARRLIVSVALTLVGALLCRALASAAVGGDAFGSLLGGGGGGENPWPALCAVAALGLRLWLLFVAPGVVLYRAVMLAVALVAARRRGAVATGAAPGSAPAREETRARTPARTRQAS